MTNQELIISANQFCRQGRLQDAENVCTKVLAGEPDNIDALCGLALVYFLRKEYEKEHRILDKALAVNPNHIDALNLLGLLHLDYYRDVIAAENIFKKILAINQQYINGLINLGNVYLASRRYDDAEKCYLKALEIDPDNGIVLNNLGAICTNRGRRQEAINYYYRVIGKLADDRETYANLLNSLLLEKRKQEALSILMQLKEQKCLGVASFPAYTFARMCCLWDDARKYLDEALEIIFRGRALVNSFESINLALLATPGLSNKTLFDIHRITGRTIDGLRQGEPYKTHENAMNRHGKLRIGYLSPDFRGHSVNNFFRGIINSHDRDRFEIFCYSNTKVEDEITEAYRRTADAFIDVTAMSDRQLADRIYADGINFLVDLAGYTQDSRICVMSYRAAPVQLSYIGYSYTTGLTSVDYFVSDSYLDGSRNAYFFTEEQLRLPESPFTFDSLREQPIETGIPLERNGFITFGTLNNTYKFSPDVIRAWAEILKRIDDAILIINHPNCEPEIVRERLWAEFGANGVEPDRVRIIWQKHPKGSHLYYYNDIDIALDTFPLTGGTTTVDSIWMGVPVVTLVGEVYHQRLSYSFLNNSGVELSDLFAFSEREYIEKAVALAGNVERVKHLHQILPDCLKYSVLRDPIQLTRHLETAYIEGWNRKFPEKFLDLELPVPAHYLPLRDGSEIAVKGCPDDMEGYVLEEQEGWFEAEYGFVLDLVNQGQRVVDIGSGAGIYAVPLAHKVAPSGDLWAAALTPADARFLAAGADRNGLKNLHLFVKGDKKLLLDREMEKHGLTAIDFVRIKLNAAAKDTLLSGESFFAVNSPLVIFGIKQDDQGIDTAFAGIFRERGYDLYRFVPGLGVLAPFSSDDELDAFSMNLFACKPDRASQLASRGLLVREIPLIGDLPGIHLKCWQDYLGAFSYTAALLPRWVETMSHHEEWEAYWVTLNLFAMAKDLSRKADERHAALQASYNILLMLVQARPTLPRALSFCRVLGELGKREAAVNVLNEVTALLDSGAELAIDEPFLPVSDEYAAMDPGGRIAEWLVASILWQREKLRAFSCYFTDRESLPVLEEIRATGFYTLEVERRITLIRKRYNL